MSRYLLIPKLMKTHNAMPEQFLLVPTEGFSEETKEIELPLNIVPIQKFKNLRHQKNFELILKKLDKVNVRKNKDGLLNIGNKLTDINFDDFVNYCCNGNFSLCYESVYCSLRENGITF